MLRGIRARAQELGWDVATVSANEDKLKQINGVQDLGRTRGMIVPLIHFGNEEQRQRFLSRSREGAHADRGRHHRAAVGFRCRQP